MENNQDLGMPTVISTFAGCGGSSLGYKMAGFRELLAVEWDDNAVETFRLNFPDVPVYHGDIAKLTGDECMRLAGIGKSELDILDGSPPCQGFSTAGKRKFNDPRNSLFMEFARLLFDLQPKVFVMENVTGMIKGCMRQSYLQIIKILRECGYKARGEVMNAMWFGVPQSRQRVIIIGAREDLGIEPSHPKPQRRTIGVSRALGAGGMSSGWRGDIKNAQFHNKWRLPSLPSPTLNASQRPVIKIEIHPGYKDAYFREGPSPTLAAGRRTRILAETCKSGEARYITIDEAKVLQSFPESFMVGEYKLIGNSVPPLLMRAIAEHIKVNILERIDHGRTQGGT